jgi:hypothetical protein
MGETRKLVATLGAEFGTACVVALALSGSAEAHDRDCHGMPISEAEKLGCCGAGDAQVSPVHCSRDLASR